MEIMISVVALRSGFWSKPEILPVQKAAHEKGSHVHGKEQLLDV
jgi:hypothetical protein